MCKENLRAGKLGIRHGVGSVQPNYGFFRFVPINIRFRDGVIRLFRHGLLPRHSAKSYGVFGVPLPYQDKGILRKLNDHVYFRSFRVAYGGVMRPNE